MPCLEQKDLSNLATQHIEAQKAVIGNLRTRMTELESDVDQLKDDPDSPRYKESYKALTHLKQELDGEVPENPGSLKFRRDSSKQTAEDRAAVMAKLYKDREHYEFHDTTKKTGEPRTSSLFGYPTIQEMIDRGHTDVAEEMMVRASSLIQDRSGGRNPVDFLNTDGLEVKQALGNLIEHHHIFNNVHVNDQGRVEFKSAKVFADSNGELKVSVIPSYWNAEKHGRNTQFIGLMDGMHAGEDPVTHLHYYRFTGKESEPIKAKLRNDVPRLAADASKRRDKLQSELESLTARKQNPKAFERQLEKDISVAETALAERKKAAKGLLSKAKKDLSGDQLARREAVDATKREIKGLTKQLEEHRTLTNLRGEIEATEAKLGELRGQVSGIKLNRLPKAERPAAKAERERLRLEVDQVKNTLKDQQKLLRQKGDIDKQISDTQKKLAEAQKLAELTPEKAVQMFDDQNGFFSFDKGFAEKGDHAVYRPMMNEEINRFYVRQTIDHLKLQHGDRWPEELQRLNESRYRSNLMERLGALVDKLPESN